MLSGDRTTLQGLFPLIGGTMTNAGGGVLERYKTEMIQYPTELFYHSYHKCRPEPYDKPRKHEKSDGRPCAICSDEAEGYKTYTKGTSFGLISANFGEQFTLGEPFSEFSCKFCEATIRDNIRLWSGALVTEDLTRPMVGKGKYFGLQCFYRPRHKERSAVPTAKAFSFTGD